jgi:hypothetical protein
MLQLLAIVWITMSWGVSSLQLDERRVDESYHFVACLIGRNQSKREQTNDSR